MSHNKFNQVWFSSWGAEYSHDVFHDSISLAFNVSLNLDVAAKNEPIRVKNSPAEPIEHDMQAPCI
jgi:hypothetical protein